MRRNVTLLRIFGIPIKINPSWFLLLALIVFSLSGSRGVFRRWLAGEGVSEATYWALGIVGALGMFASLIAHELAHCVVARYTGTPVRGITLFIFGGVSEMGDEPPTAGAEFFMAVVGPLSSVLIGSLFLLAWAGGRFLFAWPATVNAVFALLGTVNFVLAVFNSTPAFPLDGGRVLRSVLWGLTGSLSRATSVAVALGSAFGLAMIIGGVLLVFAGGLIGGIWFIFIGFFLRQAAASSLEHMRMRQTLGGEIVGGFMSGHPVTVTPDLPLRRFVEQYVLPYHFAVFPVVDEQGRLIGTVNARDPAGVNRDDWDTTTVRHLMREAGPDVRVNARTDAAQALARLRGEAGRRLIVVEDERPIGIISLRDLLDFLALKIDLGPGVTGGR